LLRSKIDTVKKKQLILIAIVFFAFTGLSEVYSQFVVKFKPVRTHIVVVKKTKRPGTNYVWINGYWKWNKKANKYVWMDAKWVKRPGNKTWISGHWRKDPAGWIWVPGHWS
jgi:hypothetical protein